MSSASTPDGQPPSEFPLTTPSALSAHRDGIAFQLGQLTSSVTRLSQDIREQGHKIESQTKRIDELFTKAAVAEGKVKTGWTVGRTIIAAGWSVVVFAAGLLVHFLRGH